MMINTDNIYVQFIFIIFFIYFIVTIFYIIINSGDDDHKTYLTEKGLKYDYLEWKKQNQKW
jgi:hypothetical protein